MNKMKKEKKNEENKIKLESARNHNTVLNIRDLWISFIVMISFYFVNDATTEHLVCRVYTSV